MGRYLSEKLGACAWLTGLPGSGKTTIARQVVAMLRDWQCRVVLLDGDVVRSGVSAGLGYSDEDRTEHMRRVAEMAALLVSQGVAVVCAVVSPKAKHRAYARARIPTDRFIEVYIRCPLLVCEARDPKGYYTLATVTQAPEHMTIYADYERPISPELTIDSDTTEPTVAARTIAEKLYNRLDQR